MFRKKLFRIVSPTTYPKIIEIGEETPVLYNYPETTLTIQKIKVIRLSRRDVCTTILNKQSNDEPRARLRLVHTTMYVGIDRMQNNNTDSFWQISAQRRSSGGNTYRKKLLRIMSPRTY